MTAWWIHLSFSHAAAVLISALLVAVLAVAAVVRIVRAVLARRAPPPRRPLPTVDYSAAYQRQVDWLGDRFLLAKSINRRTHTTTVPEMLRR
jgi:hypothetical protein